MDLMKIVLEDGDLRLRPIRINDKDDIFREFTTEITRYMTPMPSENIDGVINFINGAIKRIMEGSNIQLVLENAQTNEFYGCFGLHHVDRTTPEFGLWLKKGAHGHGYGRKSIHMLYDFATRNFDFDFIYYPVDRDNIASRRIPESLGGTIFKEYSKLNMAGNTLNIVEYHIPFVEKV